MKNRILILFAHPRFEKSASNAILLKYIPESPDITIHDLYERYPDFHIDAELEKKLLTEHDVIIWQHPFYWYSAPPLLKQWIDIVLEFGWAYGPGGTKLRDKIIFNTITSGGQRSAYSKDGYNRFTVKELLAPFEQTAALCKMTYLPPFALHGTHRLTKEDAIQTASQYQHLLEVLHQGDFSVEEALSFPYLNDWIAGKMI
jgi:glutathione-regulated potassium-efflux system ancillary protein KefG